MSNARMVQNTLDWLWQQGVRDICLCPGGRNSPFVLALEKNPALTLYSGFDERATAFYALGLTQKHQRPVAIIVTSGTAVAEVLPAVIEAHYTQTPLIVVSADRPRRLRGTGSPQTIQQVDIFGSYVEKCVDVEGEWPQVTWQQILPLHLNVCFDEPLIHGITTWQPTTSSQIKKSEPALLQWQNEQMSSTSFEDLGQHWQDFCAQAQAPLLLISSLRRQDQEAVAKWLAQWPGFVYAEATSGLREVDHPFMIRSGDRYVQHLLKQKKIDAVVRIGGVPTARAWRNLEMGTCPVFSLSHLPFPGMSQGETFSGALPTMLQSLLNLTTLSKSFPSPAQADVQTDQTLAGKITGLMSLYPQAEPVLFHQLSTQIPAAATVYMGNSLPIREWDLCAQRQTSHWVQANRGANGIDGQLATALGLAHPQKELWICLGDLTTLYDANALWFWRQNPTPLKLIVMNNQGGKIFERLFANSTFYNQHDLSFAAWANQWGIPYERYQEGTSWPQHESYLLEIVPDNEQTQLFWRDYDLLWDLLWNQ